MQIWHYMSYCMLLDAHLLCKYYSLFVNVWSSVSIRKHELQCYALVFFHENTNQLDYGLWSTLRIKWKYPFLIQMYFFKMTIFFVF